jgi:hypothetical protein
VDPGNFRVVVPVRGFAAVAGAWSGGCSVSYFAVVSSAQQPHEGARSGAEFFLSPQEVAHRRYEALRAYFVEGATAAQVAAENVNSIWPHRAGADSSERRNSDLLMGGL